MPTTAFSDDSLSLYTTASRDGHHEFSTTPIYNVPRLSTGNRASPGISHNHSSSSSELSLDEETSNSPVRTPNRPDTTTLEYATGGPYEPYLQIIEEPTTKYRFRYKTELQGSYGFIQGVNSKSRTKTYPKVKLCNFKIPMGTKAIIRCSLYSAEGPEEQRTYHYHRLVGKRDGVECEDPLDYPVDAQNDYTAELQGMLVLRTKKDQTLKELINKKQRHLQHMWVENGDHLRINPTEAFKKETLEEVKNITKNKFCFRFVALLNDGSECYKEIQGCSPIFSNTISDLKSAQTNDLKICRVDKVMGTCEGNEEVFIFVDKVNKSDIQVEFFSEENQWSSNAHFTPDDVHHQVGIVFKTPPFKDRNINEEVEVYYRLRRPSDETVSEARKFTYLPEKNRYEGLGKRQRTDSDGITNTPSSAQQVINDSSSSPSTSRDDFLFGKELSTDSQIIREFIEICGLDDMDTESLYIPSVESNPSLTQLMAKPLDDFLPNTVCHVEDPSLEQTQPKLLHFDINPDEYEFDGSFSSVDKENVVKLQMDDGISRDSGRISGGTHNTKLPKIKKTKDNDKVPSLNVAEHQIMLKKGSPRALLSEKLKMVGRPNFGFSEGSCPVQLSDNPGITSIQRSPLTKENIEENTATILNQLLTWVKGKKLKPEYFQRCLCKLFMRPVGDNNNSVLHIMAASNTVVTSGKLLKFLDVLKTYNLCKALVNIKNKRDQTPLHVAASQGSVEMVRLLLAAGSDPDHKDIDHNTPLYLAMARSNLADAAHIVSVLLTGPVDLFICNKHGQSYLHIAVERKDLTMVNCLLIKMENLNLSELMNKGEDKQGNTALHVAIMSKSLEIVKILLEKGADVNPKNFSAHIPLDYVLSEEDEISKAIKELLSKYGADSEWANLHCIKEEIDSEVESYE